MLGMDWIQNGPSDLSHSSNFTKLTENVMPKKDMIYHSIMGNITNSTDPNVIDGWNRSIYQLTFGRRSI